MNAVIRRLNHLRVSVSTHTVSSYAAESSFFILLAFFPFIILVMSVLKHLPITENEFLNMILNLTPDSLAAAIEQIVGDIYEEHTGFIPFSIVTSLWSASKGVYALMKGMNGVYEKNDKRCYIRRRIYAVVYTAIFLSALIVTLGFLLLCEWLLYRIVEEIQLQWLIKACQMLMQVFMLTVLFAVIYKVFPANRDKLTNHIPGAILASCGWVIFTELYSMYVYFTNTDIYGSLATVVLALLWLYVCMYILLIGGEVNTFLLKLNSGQIK